MKVAVWDTYIPRKDGKIMNFDIIVPQEIKDKDVIYAYGKEYLKLKEEENQKVTAEECNFCHVEELKSEWESEIKQKGYYIYEMENCE